MKLEDTLNTMLKDLDDHKRDKDELLEAYVQQKLNSSLGVYKEELEYISKSLFNYDPAEVLKVYVKKGE